MTASLSLPPILTASQFPENSLRVLPRLFQVIAGAMMILQHELPYHSMDASPSSIVAIITLGGLDAICASLILRTGRSSTYLIMDISVPSSIFIV